MLKHPEWAAKLAPIHEKAGGSTGSIGQACEGRHRIRLGLPSPKGRHNLCNSIDMYITFGIEKIQGKRVRLHTIVYRNYKERIKKIRNTNAQLGRLLHIGTATEKQKRIFDDYKDWSEEKLEA